MMNKEETQLLVRKAAFGLIPFSEAEKELLTQNGLADQTKPRPKYVPFAEKFEPNYLLYIKSTAYSKGIYYRSFVETKPPFVITTDHLKTAYLNHISIYNIALETGITIEKLSDLVTDDVFSRPSRSNDEIFEFYSHDTHFMDMVKNGNSFDDLYRYTMMSYDKIQRRIFKRLKAQGFHIPKRPNPKQVKRYHLNKETNHQSLNCEPLPTVDIDWENDLSSIQEALFLRNGFCPADIMQLSDQWTGQELTAAMRNVLGRVSTPRKFKDIKIHEHVKRLTAMDQLEELIQDMPQAERCRFLSLPPSLETQVFDLIPNINLQQIGSRRGTINVMFSKFSHDLGKYTDYFESFRLPQNEFSLIRNRDYAAIKRAYSWYFEHYGTRDIYPDSELERIAPIVRGPGLRKSMALQLRRDGVIDINEKEFRESSYETGVRKFLEDLDVSFEMSNWSIVDGRELDFYLPKQRIAIEISPVSTHHSCTTDSWFSPKNKNYHFDKWKACLESGITLITLNQCDLDDLDTTLAHLKNIILPGRRIFARNTIIEQTTDVRTVKDFIVKYHRDGYHNARFKYLVKDARSLEIIGAFTLSPGRFGKKKDKNLELIRLAWKDGVRVVGGVGKVISRIVKDFSDSEFETLITYSQNAWGLGSGYEKAGMTLVSNGSPNVLFINPKDGSDHYSWIIKTAVQSPESVIGKDRSAKGLSLDSSTYDVNEYIEKELSHRHGQGKGYFPFYGPGSRRWELSLTC